MSVFDIGNITRRLVLSILIVCLFILLASRFDYKKSLLKLRHPLSIISITLILLIGTSTRAYASLQSDNDLRPFYVSEVKEAGLVVYLPARPQWGLDVESRNGGSAIILSTPDKHYPKASMEIILNNQYKIKSDEFNSVAFSALSAVRRKAGADALSDDRELVKVRYGEIVALEDDFTFEHDNVVYSAKSIIGLMPSGKPINIFLVTEFGKIEHILGITKKIWKNLREI